MALASSGIQIDVNSSIGNDNYGGGFVCNNSSMATDGAVSSANTASPILSSASYTFIARDVGHWAFLKAGTNLNPGWYKISSVSAGAATLDATSGRCPQYSATIAGGVTEVLNTSDGCSSSSSLSSITWTIDYSQGTPITYTDLVIGASNTLTSAAQPFGKNFVGNVITITGGTGFVASGTRFEINTITGTTAYLYSGSPGTTGSTGGTAYLGGPLASPGKAAAIQINTSSVWLTGTFTVTTTSSNVSNGIVSSSVNGDSSTYRCGWFGYGTYRGDGTSWTLLGGGSISAVFLFNWSGNYKTLKNIIIDGGSKSGVSGLYALPYMGLMENIHIKNTPNYGMRLASNSYSWVNRCWMTNIGSTAFAIEGAYNNIMNCEVYDSTGVAFGVANGVHLQNCIAANISNYGFQVGTANTVKNCIAYNCTNGFICSNNTNPLLENCYAENCTSFGFYANAGILATLKNCGGYNNTSGNYGTGFVTGNVRNFITVTGGSAFTNAASKDFSLNNTANRGAALRGAGYPGIMPSTYTTGYEDIGAVQPQNTGGGSTYIINKKTNIYINGEDYGS